MKKIKLYKSVENAVGKKIQAPFVCGVKDIHNKVLYVSTEKYGIDKVELISDDNSFLKVKEDTTNNDLISVYEIHYTTNDNSIIDYNGSVQPISNVYENGQGVMTFSDVITSVEEWSFYGKTSITSIILPNSVEIIGNNAFRSCTNLTSVTILGGVINIDNNAFSECIKLTEINIPETVINIGNTTFNDCESLKNIIIPDSVENIGWGAFSGCSNIIFQYSGTATGYPWGATGATLIQ